MPIDYKKLAKVLVDSELVTEDKMKMAQEKARADNLPLEKVLVDDEYIADELLGQVIADIFNVPYINLKKVNIDQTVMNVIPEIVARKQKIITFAKGPEGIKMAMHDPSNEELINFINKKTGDNIIIYFASLNDITEALAHYKKGIKEEFDEIIKENVSAARKKKETERELPITKIVDTIFDYAYNNKVSDIHIEPHDLKVVVRFRIDGILHDVVYLPKDIHNFVVTRIKIMARLRTDEHRAAQDGRLEFKIDDEQVDVRVSIVPVSDGEKVVMRLLSEKSRQFKLSELGLEKKSLEIVKRSFQKPHGMILATGPTGSGKTTTLYAILKILNTREVNIATIEDPVEYDIEGVNQIQVNPKTNLTFAKGLKSILRQDPDIVMVGEIRDEETAGIAINAAMTGHLVLSTLHTNDAPTTLPRLLDMKIEPFLIASTVNVAIAQRLVRKVHQGCMESYQPDQKELQQLKESIGEERYKKYNLEAQGVRLYRGKGCKLCNQTGYEGRIGIFEALEMTEEIRQLIMDRSNSEEIRKMARSQGMIVMLEDGISKAIQGLTTIDEVLRATRE